MMFRRRICVAAALMMMPAAVQADDLAAEPGIEGRHIAERLFATMDRAGRGTVDMGEVQGFGASVFAGMDYDGDDRVTYREFAGWDPGFAAVAAEQGRADAHVTASKIVFAFWDRDGDDEIALREMRFAMTADFRRADLDQNALLTETEFIRAFPVIVAMRAAIRPDL